MSEKKSFFANLEPKTAALVGVITGILVLCTVGFVILLIVMFGNKAAANPQDGDITENPAPTGIVKSVKPVVELFVMAYCPYGLQMEKAFLPAWELLQNKADISVKFVYYAMHGLKEVEENTRQYCIAAEQPDKIIPYLKCFTGKDDYQACLAATGVNTSKLNACVGATNQKYGIITKYNDQSTWLSGQYPLYPVYQDLNDQYGVQGSPTLVINGTVVDGVARNPEAVKQAICAAFTDAPAECSNALSTVSTGAGFGNTAGTASAAECGN